MDFEPFLEFVIFDDFQRNYKISDRIFNVFEHFYGRIAVIFKDFILNFNLYVQR